MSNATKTPAGEATCPNCDAPVNIPKSTRSIICKSCDAIIKIVGTEEGVELKLVGKSVEEDPTYQEIEAQVAEVKAELAEMHVKYEREMARPLGKKFGRLAVLGTAVTAAGFGTAAAVPLVGLLTAAAGATLAAFGVRSNRARKRERTAVTTEMSKTIERLGAQRDLLQRKAARLKTEV